MVILRTIEKPLVILQNKKFVLAFIAFIALSGVAMGSKTPMLSSLMQGANGRHELTLVARADGTFDINEFAIQNQWFAPDVVGSGLKITAAQRFGTNYPLDHVSVLLKADPGVHEKTIHAALVSLRNTGFQRVGMTDPRLRAIARSVSASSL